MGIKIIAGGGFTSQDTATSPKLTVIDETLAKKHFPKVNPIGRMFRADRDKPDLTRIVGICTNAYYHTSRDGPPPQFFLPYVQQTDFRGMTYQLRTTLSTAALASTLRNAVQSIDPDLPVTSLRTQREQINATLQMERALAALTSGFGVLALALAASWIPARRAAGVQPMEALRHE